MKKRVGYWMNGGWLLVIDYWLLVVGFWVIKLLDDWGKSCFKKYI